MFSLPNQAKDYIMTVGDKTIPHELKVRAVIADEATSEAMDLPAKTDLVIDSPGAPGATYSQAEVTALKTAIDDIREALIESGITLDE
jgi:hypothetical protein